MHEKWHRLKKIKLFSFAKRPILDYFHSCCVAFYLKIWSFSSMFCYVQNSEVIVKLSYDFIYSANTAATSDIAPISKFTKLCLKQKLFMTITVDTFENCNISISVELGTVQSMCTICTFKIQSKCLKKLKVSILILK